MDVSVIVPFVGEYPQVLFTLQSIAQACHGLDFEVIAVDNYCEQAEEQSLVSLLQCRDLLMSRLSERKETEDVLYLINEDIIDVFENVKPTYKNKSGAAVEACARGNGWLKYLKYEDQLSHWQAKRVGVESSSGEMLLFIDAHCVPTFESIYRMYYLYKYGSIHSGQIDDNPMDPDYDEGSHYYHHGTMHFPLTYKILEYHRLMYKMWIEAQHFYTYKFTPFRPSVVPYEVPVMSTCGMMISRELYQEVGGWPEGLGIYGGGENFMNYTLAVLGYKKFINPHVTLFHHGEKRDYHYVHDDTTKNRMLAHYLFGGKKAAENYASTLKGSRRTIRRIMEFVFKSGAEQRKHICQRQKHTIEDWVAFETKQ